MEAPTVRDVIEYVQARQLGLSNDDCTDLWEYYENADWRLSNGRKMKDWRLAVNRWARRIRKGAARTTSPYSMDTTTKKELHRARIIKNRKANQ